MPIDFTKPTTADTYTTIPPGIKDAINALAMMLDPTLVGTVTSPPTGAKRLNESSGLVERFGGTSWAEYTGFAYAKLASPVFTGNPTAPTQAADNNSVRLATTAYYCGQAGSSAPAMNGTAAAGTSLRFARADHVHPVDTSRAPLNSPTFTGTPTAPSPAAGDNSLKLATTGYVQSELSAYLAKAGGTITGAVVTTSTIYGDSSNPLRFRQDAGYLSGYNTLGTVRTGYLQFNTGADVLLMAEQSNALRLGAEGAERMRLTALLADLKTAARTTPVAVAYAATLAIDASKSNLIKVGTLTGNVTTMTISNGVEGQFLSIRFKQDATGSRTVALPAGAKVDGTPATAANRTNYLNLTYNATDARWEGNWFAVPA